jgi:hypothetical protein
MLAVTLTSIGGAEPAGTGPTTQKNRPARQNRPTGTGSSRGAGTTDAEAEDELPPQLFKRGT